MDPSLMLILRSVSILMQGSLRICRLLALWLSFEILLGCFWDQLVSGRIMSLVR